MTNDKIVKTKELGIVMPAVSPEQAVAAFQAYQDLAKRIITKDDIQEIQGKEFKKKSFWRKCQRFFNLSIMIVKEKREEYNGYFVYKFLVRAKAPNGAYMDGTGTCSSNEKGLLKTEHNTRAIAETRAKNRAISDLVAFGEVSAEEVTTNGHEEKDPTEEWNKPSRPLSEPNTSGPKQGQDEYFCKMHQIKLKNRGKGIWDHRATFNDVNGELVADPDGLWYWCQGKGWHVSTYQ
jgi:hypothetical protein